MAQTGLRSFYPVRRRREDDSLTANKRRKLADSSCLDVPSLLDEQQLASDDGVSNCEVSTPATRRSTRSRKGTTSTTTKKTQSTRGRRSKKGVNAVSTDVPNIQTLFQLINQASTSSDSTTTTDSNALSTVTATGEEKLSDECPLPQASSTSSSKGATPQIKSPFKAPSIQKTLTRSKISTPKSSPLKKKTASSPVHSSPVHETRGARLLRLAKEKMSTKSPDMKAASSSVAVGKSSAEERVTKTAVRRKLLTSAPPPAASASSEGQTASRFLFSSSKEKRREEVVSELYKLSKKELTQQTRFESKQKQKKESSEKKGESKSPKLREFGAFVFESPTKNEATTTRLPAYQKFHALSQPVAQPTKEAPLSSSIAVDLPLPYSYQLLEEKFRCTDTVVSMLQKRKEICTFDKLKKAVQEMSRRQFEQKNLGQMKTVYPSAFSFRQEKNIPGLYDNNQKHKYHLTVECNLNEEEEGEEGRNGEGGSGTKTTRAMINPTLLIKRRKRFNRNLTEMAKNHHRAFLASLEPPLTIPDEKVLRWHPAFALDSVPEIAAASLPTPPIKETYTTAKDVLNVAQERLAERVKAALASVGASEAGDPGEGGEAVTKKESDVCNPELKGVSAALLEKVRAKEAARAKLAIMRDPVKESQLEMLSRLPDFVRIVKGFFVTEKKAALLREDVVKKLVDSHPSRLPTDKVESHLQYLIEVLPEWIKSVKVSKGLFVKIDKKADLKSVMAKLERTKDKLAKQ